MTPARLVRQWCGFVVAALIGLCLPVELLAGTGGKIFAPNPAKPATHGIQLAVDPYWVEGYGYRPVRVTATALPKEDFDRTISIQILVDNAYWQSRDRDIDITVTQDFVLPAGAAEAAVTIAVPQYREWNRIGWNVLVDGSFAEELSYAFLPGPTQNAGNLNSAEPRVLYVDSASTARAAKPFPVPQQQNLQTAWNTLANQGVARAALPMNAATVVPGDLPTRWLDYSCLDIVQLSSAELKAVVQTHPAAWKAIRHWLAAGGNLVIYGVAAGSDWSDETRPVDTFLEESSDAGSRRPAVVWHGQPEPQIIDAVPAAVRELTRGSYYDVEVAVDGEAKPMPPSPLTGGFRWRHYQLGTVVMSKRSKSIPYENNVQPPPPAASRQLWTSRHGVSPQMGTVDFLNLLIPGVGLAPVGMFRVLITLFVIVIGPVNYFLLRRWRRLHLLLITAPICAAVVTAALFAYALIADGLVTRVRVRSFTEIDQRRGEAASWSRQSYYAGLTPRGGMNMPDDAMAVPLMPFSWNGWTGRNELNIPREMDWQDDRQRLTSGWLRSRTPMQYLVLRSGDCEKKIAVSNRNGRVAVSNQLDATIIALLVFDESKQGYWGEAIAADPAVQPLTPIETAESSAKLTALFRENEPSFPPNMEEGSELFGMSRGYYYRYGWNQQQAPTMANSRLEKSLRKYGPAYPLNPEPRTYLAIVDRSPEVAVGVDGAAEESSFHVILGRY